MATSSFVVPIGELRHERAEPKPVEVEEAVEWALDLSRVMADPPLRARMSLVPVQGGILVDGAITADVRHTCHRCLDEWVESVEVPVAQLFLTEPDDDADYVADGIEIDLEPLIRDELLLALPLVPTCRQGCRGVVDGVESDLNTPTPDDLGDSSSPFAVLKDLLDAGE